ncbi:MAG: prenyltransferase [Holosporales bacterium]|nr:prenyltransferase [Holosporales bacterium]
MFKTLVLYSRVARIHALVMSVLSVVISYLYTLSRYGDVPLNFKAFLLVAGTILLFHLAANTISEYRDCENGVDDVHSPDTKYRLITGIVPRKHVFAMGIVSFCLAGILGVLALICGTLWLLMPGIIGAGLSLFYSEKPFGLKYKAFGEICVFLAYGPLLFSSCILSMTKSLSMSDVAFSIPFGLLTTTILLANNIRDCEFDRGKTKTIVTEFGLKFSYAAIIAMTYVTLVSMPIFVLLEIVPRGTLLTLLTYPVAFLATKKVGNSGLMNTFGLLHTTFFVSVIIGFLLSSWRNIVL